MSRNGVGTYVLPAGNPVVSGAVISSATQNNTMNDMASAISQSISQDGQTPITANLPMSGFRHTGVSAALARTDYGRMAEVQDSAMHWLTSVAGTDTITASMIAPTLAAYAAGQVFRFVSTGVNTTTAVTLNINGIGAKAVTKNGSTALAAGEIPAGAIVETVYDGTQFQLVGLAANTANSGPGGTPFSFRNKLPNGAFRTNQRNYVSGTALAAGVPATGVGYGHDGWRAGAGGGAYTFTQSKNCTTITITAGTFITAAEDADIDSTAMVLSWTGTAQARVGVNGSAPSGSYMTSPILISCTAGQQVSVEFGTGTVGKVQLENGSVPTAFEYPSVQVQLARCQRYLPAFNYASSGYDFIAAGCNATVTGTYFLFPFMVTPRVPPTGLIVSNPSHFILNVYSGGAGAVTAITLATVGLKNARFFSTSSGLTVGEFAELICNSAAGQLLFTGCEL